MRSVRLRRHLGLIKNGNGHWVARDGHQRQWSINGPTWLDNLLASLASDHSNGSTVNVSASTGGEHDVRAAVRELLANGVAEIDPALEGTSTGQTVAGIKEYLARSNIGDGQRQIVQSSCRVCIVGMGEMCRELRSVVQESGLRALWTSDPITSSPFIADASLVVAVTRSLDDRWPSDINTWAIRYRRPWLLMGSDGTAGWLGPLFVPDQVCCWECLRRRFLAGIGQSCGPNDSQPVARINSRTDASSPALRRVLTGIAADEILRFVFHHQPSRCIGRIVLVDLDDFRFRAETVLRIPQCPACGRRGQHGALETAQTFEGQEQRVRALGHSNLLVGQHFGVIRSTGEMPRRWDDPMISIIGMQLADTASLGGPRSSLNTAGAGLTRDEAWCAAIGESAERYCALLSNKLLAVRIAAFADFEPGEAIDPAELALYSQEQYATTGFPMRPFRRDTVVPWVEGKHLTDSVQPARHCWIPAEFVHLAHDPTCKRPLHVPTSNGLAASTSLESALLSATYEAIERDAFLVAWWNGLRAPRVDLTSNEMAWFRQSLEMLFLWPRIDYHVADLTADTRMPVYAVISVGPSEDGLITSFGAACHPNARTALLKAMLEAAMGRSYVRQLVRDDPTKRFRRDLSDIRTFADHAQFYTRHPRSRSRLLNLVSNRVFAKLDAFAAPDTADPGSCLSQLAARLEDIGFNPAWCELTTTDVRAADLRVVRVVIPGMIPIYANHHLPPLGGARWTCPERVFPWATKKLFRRRRNATPHPYP